MEKRFFNIKSNPIEIRSNENNSKIIYGRIPYDSQSEDMGFREIIRNGAFTKTITENKKIVALLNHNSDKVLGRVKSGTLRFIEKDDALEFEIDAPNTTYANDFINVAERGDNEGISFGFQVIKDNWNYESDPYIRELIEVKLLEVSVGVTFPAYPESKTDIRSIFNSVGIDYEMLAKVIENRNKNLNEDDTKYITETINKLNSLISIDESELENRADENHSESETIEPLEDTQTEVRKRKLEIIKYKEKQI